MKWALLLLAGVAAPVCAQGQAGDLPPAELVVQAIAAQPVVAAATARIGTARAEGEALRRGPHEITAQGTLSRRDVEREGGFTEYDATISRPFRLPGKAALDLRAGAIGVDIAEDRLEDARHQAALRLAALWYDWLLAAELNRNALDLVADQRALVAATSRRVELRDASELELHQVSAALGLAEAQAGDAAANRDRARVLLASHFPDLPLPVDAPRLLDPSIPSEGLDRLERMVVERSHEIAAAMGVAERQSVLARRASADRIADPSLGLRVFSERSGIEQGVGLFASMPLGGGHRRALADQAAAEASAAAAERVMVERDVAGNAAADVAEIRARLAAWTDSSESAARAERSVQLVARGQQLGAIDLADLLYAERQANEARAQELLARAATARLILKLRIDAHTLWIE
jgi:outer membrane protein, heavy metal efflux system